MYGQTMTRKTEIVKVEPAALPAKTPSLPDLAADFLDTLDVKDETRRAYAKGLRRFIEWIQANETGQPNRKTILAFKNYLIELKLSPNTINGHLTGVRQFFSYLEAEYGYPNIARTIGGCKQAKGYLREAASIDQIRAILDAIDTGSLQGKRNYAIVYLLFRAGLRTCEITRADLEDLKFKGKEAILAIWGKGRDSKDDIAVVTEKTLKVLQAYLNERKGLKPASPLFASISSRNNGGRLTTRSIRGIVKVLFRKIGVDDPRLSAHSLRHSYATESLKAGAPVVALSRSMRHASISTTMRYVHDIERIEKAAERYLEDSVDF